MAVRRRHIRDLAEKLLDRERIRSAPIDVERIAGKLGMVVECKPAEDNLSGFLARDTRRLMPVIGVNAKHHRNRQRFTIAHEIGHFLLHEGEPLHVDKGINQLRRNRDEKSSEGIDKHEIEANLFAAELLMPARLLVKDVERMEGKDLMDEHVLAQLAEKYGVSVQAMTLRLNYLNYVGH